MNNRNNYCQIQTYLISLDKPPVCFWWQPFTFSFRVRAQIFMWVKAGIQRGELLFLSCSALAKQLCWPHSSAYQRGRHRNYWKCHKGSEVSYKLKYKRWQKKKKNHTRFRANQVQFVKVSSEICLATRSNSWVAGEYLYFLNWVDHTVYTWFLLVPQGLLQIQIDLCLPSGSPRFFSFLTAEWQNCCWPSFSLPLSSFLPWQSNRLKESKLGQSNHCELGLDTVSTEWENYLCSKTIVHNLMPFPFT